MIANFERALSMWPDFLLGLMNTIWLCAVTGVVALVLSIPLATVMRSRSTSLRKASQFVVDTIRSVPFLLLAYMVYYGLPAFGIRVDSITAGLATLIVYNTAYFAEIIRGAWSHLPPQQEETARAFCFTGTRLFVHIIGPQILIAAGPVLGNQMIQIIKDSAFLMVITIHELTFAANEIQTILFVPFETFIIAGLLYWVLCNSVEFGVSRLERFAEVRRAK